MIEFEAVGGKPLFINPALVEAIETAAEGPMKNPRAGIKLASGKDYVVEGAAQDVAEKLFPGKITVQRLGSFSR